MGRIALIAGCTIVCLAALVFLWTASGLYNVAASRPHWAVTEAIIAFGLDRSVATHSLGIKVPALDTPDQIRLGAAHFDNACASCHGSPDAAPDVVARHMLPPPPDLDGVAARWDAAELAWIIEHGLKYTGMPAWPARNRRDEIWPLVSFLRALPMAPDQYRAMAGGTARSAERASPAFCGTCHGDGASRLALVPPLAGQAELYLVRALTEYASGARPSGIMGPIAGELSPAEMRSLAGIFADMPAGPVAATSDMAALRGGRIARAGIVARDIPACLTCHDGAARADYPILAGLPAAYIAGQLQLWQAGGRAETGFGAVMATIARRLQPDEVHDLARFFATLDGTP